MHPEAKEKIQSFEMFLTECTEKHWEAEATFEEFDQRMTEWGASKNRRVFHGSYFLRKYLEIHGLLIFRNNTNQICVRGIRLK